MDRSATLSGPDQRVPLGLRLLAVPAVALVVGGGLWLVETFVARTRVAAIAIGVAWFVAVAIVTRLVVRRRPELRLPVRGTFLAIALLAAGAFYWTSVRDTEVDERVVVGVPVDRASGGASRGAGDRSAKPAKPMNVQIADARVASLSHEGSGKVAVVELARGGRRLTLRDFQLDPGPLVNVYLTAGRVDGSDDVKSFKDLGELKGNKGNQQYEIPRGVDLEKYRTVVFWCIPFRAALAKAELKPS